MDREWRPVKQRSSKSKAKGLPNPHIADAPTPRVKAAKRTRRQAADRQDALRQQLGVELYARVRFALARFDFTPDEQRAAMAEAWKLDTAPAVSGPLLRDGLSLSELLREWSQAPQYLDAHGSPRVLPIEGGDVSFEGLAHRFLPHLPLEEVIHMACEIAEVSIRPGDKIALLGGVMVNHSKSRTKPLAYTIRQIDQLLETSLHNAKLSPDRLELGRMQRVVTGMIPRSEYKAFMRESRPQIADMIGRAEASMEYYQSKATKNAPMVAVSVIVYVAEEDDWERVGFDATTSAQRTRR
jgi:hypothetical protein